LRLSKSLYTRGLQCPKSLWLAKYNKKALAKPNASQKGVFENGDEVGVRFAPFFAGLNHIHNGTEAMQIYPKLVTTQDKQKVSELREALLRYCELDTLAMVKILEKMRKL